MWVTFELRKVYNSHTSHMLKPMIRTIGIEFYKRSLTCIYPHKHKVLFDSIYR